MKLILSSPCHGFTGAISNGDKSSCRLSCFGKSRCALQQGQRHSSPPSNFHQSRDFDKGRARIDVNLSLRDDDLQRQQAFISLGFRRLTRKLPQEQRMSRQVARQNFFSDESEEKKLNFFLIDDVNQGRKPEFLRGSISVMALLASTGEAEKKVSKLGLVFVRVPDRVGTCANMVVIFFANGFSLFFVLISDCQRRQQFVGHSVK